MNAVPVLALVLAAPLRVSLAPPAVPQGAVVRVAVTSAAPLASAVLVDGEKRVILERADGGMRFSGLLGVDFEAKPGRKTVVVEGTDASGAAVSAAAPLRVVARRFPVNRLTVDPKFVEPPPEEEERIARDREAFRRAFANPLPERIWAGRFALPVETGSRRNFGARRVFNGRTRSRHAGLDLAAPSGAAVTAPAAATAVLAGDFYFPGGSVLLDHGGGLMTMYFHLSRIDVKEGDRVAPGQRIGAVGATGRATGPHLHWGARLHGARVDPVALLSLPALPAFWRPGPPTRE